MQLKPNDENFPIKVVKYASNKDAYYIGRGSPLGNPFKMSDQTDEERERVCDEYEKYFAEKIEKDDVVFTTELASLVKKTIEDGYIKLGCYCSPQRCHGDTIARFLNKVLCQ